MSDYTPTTNEVRDQWGNAVDYYRSPQQRLPGFDLWLSELIRKEREDAWTEGFDRGFYRGQVLPGDRDASEAGIENPYRKE